MAIVRSDPSILTTTTRRVPPRLWSGLALVAISWWASWYGPESLGSHSFFPLWFGYILTIDAIVGLRTGTSILQRSRVGFALLFVSSTPLWWGFELANSRLDNWQYTLPHHYSWLRYHLEATVAFSTVLPAVLETTELMRATRIVRSLRDFRPALTGDRAVGVCITLGIAMIVVAIALPNYCFPLLWIGPFFIVDPINLVRGQPSLFAQARRGAWRMALALGIAGLICGFFWEMWNSRAMPKWTYSVPYVGSPKLFEMPVLGYGGYIPFAFELYAAYHFLASLAPKWFAGVVLAEHDGAQQLGDHA